MAGRSRRIWISLGAALVGAALIAVIPTGYVQAAAAGKLATTKTVPEKQVAIVFGAGVNPDGTPQPYLRARLDLSYELFRTGKVRAILVSGDNRRANYNEPVAMRSYLIARGVPPAKVVADYAGLDTYSTCVRASRIFGITEAILVSQSYHLPRAVATCRAAGVDAWGVGDAKQSQTREWSQYSLREWPANAKLVLDLLSGRLPILGEVEHGITQALKP